jgi:biopolymer transport protein ExbD
MRTFSHPHANAESHGIDLAPMLDFVVNVLKQAGITVERPAASTKTAKPSKSIVVVDARGEIWIDDITFTTAQLATDTGDRQ